ncbi:hypothetical protein M231_02148 [Tremella mesenterica]|uniref:Uncharacterized protein n=1 Tax=Tremella mesenterica TaxID=5217 RepID=A0A4Q1BRA1_TREME|nr:hypothetical protein M231_02148 [Tremella mesenterica]
MSSRRDDGSQMLLDPPSNSSTPSAVVSEPISMDEVDSPPVCQQGAARREATEQPDIPMSDDIASTSMIQPYMISAASTTRLGKRPLDGDQDVSEAKRSRIDTPMAGQ